MDGNSKWLRRGGKKQWTERGRTDDEEGKDMKEVDRRVNNEGVEGCCVERCGGPGCPVPFGRGFRTLLRGGMGYGGRGRMIGLGE